jgi:NSS family neurotransmitter:Na+ symporter
MKASDLHFAHESWSSRIAFLFAAVGSAVGLGNLWRFPYVAGENGGGAFVLVYIVCVLILGLPLITAELMIGRRGQQSAIRSIRVICRDEGLSPGWAVLGWMMIITPLAGLTYYSVVAGWGLAYIFETAAGNFVDIGGEESAGLFGALTSSPVRMAFWHGVFMATTIFFVARGVHKGLEKAAYIMMPGLFIILVVLVIYAGVAADFRAGFDFLFNVDFSKITLSTVLIALGQAFFSLAVAVGVMMTYGAYLSKDVSIPRAAGVIVGADTLVALLAGLAIFPVVFASGLPPDEGPGLIFVTMPVAFGQMPAGVLFGTLFFILLAFAAITTGIGMLEPAISWLEERQGLERAPVTVAIGTGLWAIGLSSVFSFNIWSDVFPLGFVPQFADKTVFGLLDFIVATFFIPVGGLLIALFAGWAMSRRSTNQELALGDGPAYRLWHTLVRYVAPIALVGILVSSMLSSLE